MRTKISTQIHATAVEISADTRRVMQDSALTDNQKAGEYARYSGMHKIDGLQTLTINIGGTNITPQIVALQAIWTSLLKSDYQTLSATRLLNEV